MSGFSVLTLLLVSRMVMSTCGQDYSDQYDVASVIDPGDLPVLSENVVQTEPRQQQEVLPLLTQDSEVGAVVAAEDMCRVSTGESNIVLDLEESRGTDYSQKTRPRELPILGEVGRDINLELVFPTGYTIFTLQDKSLHLTEPLDRDESDLSSIVFQVTCTVLSSRKRRTIPIIVRVTDLNDNSPQFLGTPYTLTLEENTPVNTTVFTELKAVDDDSGRNSQIEYNVVRGDGSENDGFGYFAINFPHQVSDQINVRRSEISSNYLIDVSQLSVTTSHLATGSISLQYFRASSQSPDHLTSRPPRLTMSTSRPQTRPRWRVRGGPA